MGMINMRMPILSYTIQVIPNVCNKFQNPRWSIIWEIYETNLLCNTFELEMEKENNDITKTCLYNFDPLKPYFCIVKLGFTAVYIIFLISAQNIYCEYSLERLNEVVLTSTQNLCFEKEMDKSKEW